MPSLTTLAADAAPEEINACLDRDGAVILRDVLSPQMLETLKGELMPYLDAITLLEPFIRNSATTLDALFLYTI